MNRAEAGLFGKAAKLCRGEGVNVDLGLELVAVAAPKAIFGQRRGADHTTPKWGGKAAGPLGDDGDAVTVSRRLAAEGHRPSGAQDTVELGEGPAKVGDVMKDRVPEDEVEARIGEGQGLGLRAGSRHIEPEALSTGGERAEHAGGDVGRGHPLDETELKQVEGEVAGSGTDLERVAERRLGLRTQRFDDLGANLFHADLAVVDTPFGVVLARGGIVVARVDVLDVLGRSARGGRHRGKTRWRRAVTMLHAACFVNSHVQENQPPGVPPLPLTGERTLPDVREENYWFRRHLAVYEWIRARVGGLSVADLACGEGYGTNVLARTAAEVVGVDANPEAHEHAKLRYTAANVGFERALVESYKGPCDAIVFLQTIEHVHEPAALLDGFARAAPVSYVSTPNRLTLAPAGAKKSDNPWHLREYTAAEYRGLLAPCFSRVELYGLFHARKLRLHELAIDLGWDRVHKAVGVTKPFYDRFVPAIAASDFKLEPEVECDLDKALDFIAVCRR